MRRATAFPSLVLVLAACILPAVAGGNANFALGSRQLQDDEFWNDVDSQAMFGVTVDFGPADWPVTWAVGYYFSATQEDTTFTSGNISVDGEVTAAVGELSFGVRTTWNTGATRPFVEGGLAAVIAGLDLEADTGSIDDSDAGAGAYVQAGVYWRLGSRFNLGLNARALFGSEIDLGDNFGEDFSGGDADYVSGGLILGWGWPAE
jgi:hypothetical protein